jgi:microcystin-dependent protein
MPDPFLSEIKLMAFIFAPKGWAICAGQLLPINQNQALFALLGTTYGGNGQTTFALPDLRGRAALGRDAASLAHFLGAKEGAETITLATTQMPAHTHTVEVAQFAGTPACRNAIANQRGPVNNLPAIEANGVAATYSTEPPNAAQAAAAATVALTAANAGGGQAHENRQPYAVLNYCIALQGIFPSPN